MGLLVSFLSLAKIVPGIAIAYGAWTIWKKDKFNFSTLMFNFLRCSRFTLSETLRITLRANVDIKSDV